MNRNLVILFAAIVALALVYLLVIRKPWRSLGMEQSEFAVKDTSLVTRIFIADRKSHSVTLDRNQNNEWLVNNRLPADNQKIQLMLSTLHDMRVLKPVDPAAHNKVIAVLASEGIKTEIYAGQELIETFYVGSETPDQAGTFMLSEGAPEPYVVHIPGFVGYLTPRFYTEENRWKSRLVFNYRPEEILSLRMNYPGDEKSSFSIDNKAAESKLLDDRGSQKPADPKFIKYYLAGYNNLYLETYETELSKEANDSILRAQPFCEIELKTAQGRKKLTVFLKRVDQRTRMQYTPEGKKLDFDTERFYAKLDEEQQLAVIQQYNFGRLFLRLQDFK